MTELAVSAKPYLTPIGKVPQSALSDADKARIRETTQIIAQVMKEIKEEKPQTVKERVDAALISGAKATPGVASAIAKGTWQVAKQTPWVIEHWQLSGMLLAGAALYTALPIRLLSWFGVWSLDKVMSQIAESGFSSLPTALQAYLTYSAYEWMKNSSSEKEGTKTENKNPIISKEVALGILSLADSRVRALAKSIVTSNAVLSTTALCASIDYANTCTRENAWVPKAIVDTANSVKEKIQNAASFAFSGMKSLFQQIAKTKTAKALFNHSGKATAITTGAVFASAALGKSDLSAALAFANLAPFAVHVHKLATS